MGGVECGCVESNAISRSHSTTAMHVWVSQDDSEKCYAVYGLVPRFAGCG